jgi:glycerol kinase
VCQVEEVLEVMQRDSGVSLKVLKVDGGMTANNLLMQFQVRATHKQAGRQGGARARGRRRR